MKRREFIRKSTFTALLASTSASHLIHLAGAAESESEIAFASQNVQPRILISTTASKSEVRAAQELTHYWGKITGKTLAFERNDNKPPSSATQPLVIIGHHPANADLASQIMEVEETIIDAQPGMLRLIGGREDPIIESDGTVFARDRGTLYAVYNLLDELGVRWYRPESWGEHVPQSSAIKVLSGRHRHKPYYKYRMGFQNYRYWSNETPAQNTIAMRWAYRNRQNTVGGYFIRNEEYGGTHFIHTRHNYANLVPPKKYFGTHPEYYALIDGKRNEKGQLCVGNAEVQQIVVQAVLDFADKYRRFETVSLEPNDNALWCQCDLCKAMDDPIQHRAGDATITPTRPMGNISMSNRVASFGKIIATEVAKHNPKIKVAWLAYGQEADPPSKVHTLPDNILLSMAAFSSAFSDPQDAYSDYSKNLLDPTSVPNQRYLKVIEGWGKLAETIAREYWSGIAWMGPMPLVRTMKDRLTAYQKFRIIGFYNEVHPHWGPQGIDLYFFTRLAWDPEMDIEKELDLYCENYYGPAAAPMKKYHRLLEDAAHAGIPHYSYGINTHAIFTPEVFQKMTEYINKAKILINDQEPYRQRFEGVWAGYEYTRLVLPYFPLLAEAQQLPQDSPQAREKYLQAAIHWERANKFILTYKNGDVFDNGVMFGSLQFFGRYGGKRGLVPEDIRQQAKEIVAGETP